LCASQLLNITCRQISEVLCYALNTLFHDTKVAVVLKLKKQLDSKLGMLARDLIGIVIIRFLVNHRLGLQHDKLPPTKMTESIPTI